MNLIATKWGAVVLAAGLFTASCSGPEVEGATPDSPATTAVKAPEVVETTLPPAVPEIAEATRPSLEIDSEAVYADPIDKILDRYYLYLQAYYYATAPPVTDPNYQPLMDLVTGARAAELPGYFRNWSENNYVTSVDDWDAVTSDVRFLSALTFSETEGSTVEFQDCHVDPSDVILRNSGEVVDEGPRTFLYGIELTYVTDDWKVSRHEQNNDYEGVSTCPDRP